MDFGENAMWRYEIHEQWELLPLRGWRKFVCACEPLRGTKVNRTYYLVFKWKCMVRWKIVVNMCVDLSVVW